MDSVDLDVLDSVLASLGQPIGSHAPPEIALSLLAEIVTLKNGAAAAQPAHQPTSGQPA